ncbi:MAG: hypothetical protein KA253_06670 [Campylobacteraceae bacterium]|nr:hypothetical protein [Campylobacteraceae bacterium]
MLDEEGNVAITNASPLYKIKKTWLAWIVLVIGLLVTIFLSLHVKQNHEQEAVKHLLLPQIN